MLAFEKELTSSEQIAILQLMRLVSPALPIGSYAYSQGLEYAIDQHWINDNIELRAWLAGVMRNSLAYLDLPIIIRLHRAWLDNDFEAVRYWNNIGLASRETKELYFEDTQLGLALERLLRSLSIEEGLDAIADVKEDKSFLTVFTCAGCHFNLSAQLVTSGFCWSWLENQIAVATKTVPIGQTDGQKMLSALLPLIPELTTLSLTLADDELGVGLPGLAIASSLHERQYSRLFRS